jgi:hypothetical protein
MHPVMSGVNNLFSCPLSIVVMCLVLQRFVTRRESSTGRDDGSSVVRGDGPVRVT